MVTAVDFDVTSEEEELRSTMVDSVVITVEEELTVTAVDSETITEVEDVELRATEVGSVAPDKKELKLKVIANFDLTTEEYSGALRTGSGRNGQ